MPVSVNAQTVHPRKLAAVRREVAAGAVGSAWRPALDKVWAFIRSQPGLWTDGTWMAANRRESAGHSWEIYGDPTADPADTPTTVMYLLT
jgi:hypothetical protein